MNLQDDSNEHSVVIEVGKRLLHNPSKELIRRVYGGSYEWYRRCVIANFPGCDQEIEEK